MFERLVDYQQINGHTRVPQNYEKYGLGLWVAWQRTRKKQEELDSSRVTKLNQFRYNSDLPFFSSLVFNRNDQKIVGDLSPSISRV